MSKQKRLLKTLTGHYHELCSVFARTAAHKLPSAKGMLREKAVERFIAEWLPNRFTAQSNVFATTRTGREFSSELDIVIHDSNSGAIWNLDAYGENSVATWEEIKLIVQVKSILRESDFDNACESMSGISTFSEEEGIDIPIRILFAYKVHENFAGSLLEKFTYSSSDSYPFDAFILLDLGAYFSGSLRELRVGIEHGISPNLVANDGPSQSKLIVEDCIESRIPNGYQLVSSGENEITLLSFAALTTLATSGDDTVQALLAACMQPEYYPIFNEPEPNN